MIGIVCSKCGTTTSERWTFTAEAGWRCAECAKQPFVGGPIIRIN